MNDNEETANAFFQGCSFENTKCFSFEGKNIFTKILDVYDGDTVTIAICVDNCKFRTNCRLIGIDCEEIKSKNEIEKKNAQKARQHLIFLLTGQKIKIDSSRRDIKNLFSTLNCIVKVSCGKFDKYGRILATIWKNDVCINDEMIKQDLAVSYDGKTARMQRLPSTPPPSFDDQRPCVLFSDGDKQQDPAKTELLFSPLSKGSHDIVSIS